MNISRLYTFQALWFSSPISTSVSDFMALPVTLTHLRLISIRAVEVSWHPAEKGISHAFAESELLEWPRELSRSKSRWRFSRELLFQQIVLSL